MRNEGLYPKLDRSPHPLLRLAQHVHRSLVDAQLQLVGVLLQLLQALAGLPRVVGLEVVRRVGLAEELTLGLDPVVLLQHSGNLEPYNTGICFFSWGNTHGTLVFLELRNLITITYLISSVLTVLSVLADVVLEFLDLELDSVVLLCFFINF